MSRRLFLERVAALAGSLLAAPVARAAAERRIELQRSPVAGFQYHAGESLWGLLAAGDALDLVREPQNPYDSRAVRVDWQGKKLGYVPRAENAAVCHLLDAGQSLAAEIVRLQMSRNPWERIEFAIHLRV